tara:strand:- start:1046 stop:1663 length:618 start_codon:yes stop_codon:yes gene_type:complete
MEMKKDWSKWIALGLGGIIGVSHIGMIGIISNRKAEDGLPKINLPESGPYSSYNVIAKKDGYSIEYKANDPKTMITTKDVKRKGGFLGLANETVQVVQEYTMDGSFHHGGPVSTRSAWIDPAALGGGEKKPSDKTIECIKAVGGAEQSGRLVGSSVGAAAAPTLSGIPFVGWLAAGWVTMFGGDQGSKIGGGMAKGLSDACVEEL